MFSKNLNKRKELHSKIGTSFDANFDLAVKLITESIRKEGALFFAGNGGSAAESQHMSAEYIQRLEILGLLVVIQLIQAVTLMLFLAIK